MFTREIRRFSDRPNVQFRITFSYHNTLWASVFSQQGYRLGASNGRTNNHSSKQSKYYIQGFCKFCSVTKT